MRKFYNVLLVTFVVLLALALGCTKVNAATFSMSSNVSSVEPGGQFVVTLTSDGAGSMDLLYSNITSIEGDEVTGNQVWVEGSTTITCYASTDGETATISASGIIADFKTGEDDPDPKSDSVSVTINQPEPAPVEPEPEVPADPSPAVVDPEPAKDPEPTTTPEPTTVPEPTATPEPTPEPTPTKSSNANLGNLGITPNDFTGFRYSVTSYEVSVPYDVDEIEVYANKLEDSQTISGTGNKSLSEGSNVFDVTVTAEDGTEKTYTIVVVRLAKEKTNEPNINNNNKETKTELALSSIQIEGVTLNETFKPNVYEYTAKAKKDAKTITVKATANIQDAIIDVDSPNEFKDDGETTIKITVKEKDGDSKKIYLIKVSKEAEEKEPKVENTTTSAAVGKTDSNNKNGGSGITKETIIYCIGVGIVTGLGILFAVIRYRKDQGYGEEYDDDEFDFVGDISTKEAIKDAAVATSKLSGANKETAEEGPSERKRGKHF